MVVDSDEKGELSLPPITVSPQLRPHNRLELLTEVDEFFDNGSMVSTRSVPEVARAQPAAVVLFIVTTLLMVGVMIYFGASAKEAFMARLHKRSSDSRAGIDNGTVAAIIVGALIASLPVPAVYSVVCICSGYALGVFWGFVVITPALLVGMCLMFFASRLFLHNCAYHAVVKHYPHVHFLVAAHSTVSIVVLRLTPIPFALQTMLWASASNVRFHIFFLASSVIVVPQVFLFAYLGSTATNLASVASTGGNWREMVWAVTLCLVAVGAYCVMSMWAKKRILATMHKTEEEERNIV